MLITFYKDCPIPNDYSIVWNNYSHDPNDRTAHQKLLNSLTSQILDIQDIYLDDTGELTLPLKEENDNIWYMDYNYMSYELQRSTVDDHYSSGSFIQVNNIPYSYIDNNGVIQTSTFNSKSLNYYANYLKRYAFIKSIEYYNDCIKIKYECDIFSTYMPFVNGGYGTVRRFSDACLYGACKSNTPALTTESDLFSNSALIKYTLAGSNIGTQLYGDVLCYCFATIQYYDTDNEDKVTERRLDSIMIAYDDANHQITENTFTATVSEWNEKIKKLITYQSNTKTDIFKTYYEFQEIYLLPVNMVTTNDQYDFATWIQNLVGNNALSHLFGFALSETLVLTWTNNYVSPPQTETMNFAFISLSRYCKALALYPPLTELENTFTISNGSIPNRFDRAGIGLFTHMIDVDCNNPLTNFEYKITFSFDFANIRIYIDCINKVIEITNDLELKIPIQISTADVMQLNGIKREIANKKNVTNAVAGGTQSILGTVAGIIAGNPVGAVSSAVSGVQNTVNAVLDNKLINAKAYTSNKSLDVESVGFINAYYGLIDYRINPINSDEFIQINDRKGYILNCQSLAHFYSFLPNGVLFENLDALANVEDKIRYMSMSDCYLLGNLTTDIRAKLNAILDKGFRFITTKHATDYASYL